VEFTRSDGESSLLPASASFRRFAAHLPLSTFVLPTSTALVTFPQGSFCGAGVLLLLLIVAQGFVKDKTLGAVSRHCRSCRHRRCFIMVAIMIM